jgi:hypothetical protein
MIGINGPTIQPYVFAETDLFLLLFRASVMRPAQRLQIPIKKQARITMMRNDVIGDFGLCYLTFLQAVRAKRMLA